MKKIIASTLSVVMALSLAACGSSNKPAETEAAAETSAAEAEAAEEVSALTDPVNLTFSAQEVGTGAYTVAAAVQAAMLKGLPAGNTIDLTTNIPGGVGAPVLIQN